MIQWEGTMEWGEDTLPLENMMDRFENFALLNNDTF
jgi:hypothetical protein